MIARRSSLLFLSLVGLAGSTCAGAPARTIDFGRWLSPYTGDNRVRGGTTRGGPVRYDFEPNKYYRQLQKAKNKKQKDRLAILALSGGYRVTFEFSETTAFAEGYRLARPYRSWGTEYVYVLADEPGFISLQHILVMFYRQDGKLMGPLVMKHWRQDWRYRPEKAWFFDPDGGIRAARVRNARGRWLQSVYQVDDSPRYAVVGEWRHLKGTSSFEARGYRPLPRRESTVRRDYQAMLSGHKIYVMKHGWLHEQDSLKAVVRNGGVERFIAKEQGFNRYQRLKDFDFARGHDYFRKTEPFWKLVRDLWARKTRSGRFSLRKRVKGKLMFQDLFGYAGRLARGQAFDAAAAKTFIDAAIAPYIISAD